MQFHVAVYAIASNNCIPVEQVAVHVVTRALFPRLRGVASETNFI